MASTQFQVTTLWLFVLTVFISSNAQKIVTINTPQGSISGKQLTTEGKQYFEFLGIPYAQPPVGPLRFKPPRPATPWQGVRNGLQPSSRCPQLDDTSHVIGSEDCLFLNVYTPQLPQENVSLKAVMVFIHGGGFYKNHGYTYGPKRFLSKGILLVTLNYRLGVLGFLSMQNKDLPGNYGLKDQLLALKWIQKNIASYGGDPKRVTIFGNSAGGASVEYMTLSKQARGLFQNGILQSGTTLNPFAYNSRPKKSALQLARVLGYNSTDEKELYRVFMRTDFDKLVTASLLLLASQLEDMSSGVTGVVFAPTAEPAGAENPFITKTPTEILKSGDYTKVPLIIGGTDAEAIAIFYLSKVITESDFVDLNSNSSWTVPSSWNIPEGREKDEIGNALKRFYFRGQNLTWDKIDLYIDLNTDLLFHLGAQESMARRVRQSRVPIYSYQFALNIQQSYKQVAMEIQGRMLDISGASHEDELRILFNFRDTLEELPQTSTDKFISDRMTRLWSNFAKTGNPNEECLDACWEPVTTNVSYLKINRTLSIEAGIVRERKLNVWANLCRKSSSTFPCELYL